MKSPKLLLVAFCLLLSAAGTFAAPITTPPTQGPKAMGQARWWDQLQEADGLANQGDWPMAILRLQELLPQVPPPVRAMIHLRLASIFANQKDWDRAIQNGHLAIEAAPANGWVYLPVVKILHAADRDEEAVALCRDAAKNDPAVTQASLDLIKEIKRGHPLRKYFLLWLLLLGGGAAGASFLLRRKPQAVQPIPQSEHSLPNYYPITGHSYNPGDMIGHYKILSTVGSTLHSILYCALDTHLDRQVALKQVNPGVGGHGDAPIKRFQKEVKSLIALSNHHAGVVRVYDFVEPGMLVMEWVDGNTLEEAMDRLGAERALEVGIELCNILAFAHSMGIVHRDIKPSNIMLTTQTRQVRLLDFGIAKNAGLGTSSLTIDGSTPIGTFTYMAPEQFAAPNQAQPAADIYSLGLTLYRALTGRMPTDPWFGPRTFSLTPEAEFAPITVESPAIQRYLAQHPVETDWVADLDEAIRKAFRERPGERYENANEFGERLKGIWHRIANLPHTGDLKRS